MSKPREEHFRSDAKQLVDQLFDNNLFVEDLTRDDLNDIEDLVAYLLESKFDSYVKANELLKKLSVAE